MSADGRVEFNTSFEIVPEALTDLLVKESITSDIPMILMIKRPDFLGDSRWEFRHDNRIFEARIEDQGWMTGFRGGSVSLQPGDALRSIVRSTLRYGYDGEVVDSKHEIMRVLEVIRTIRPSQGDLFRPPEVP